MPGVGLYLGVVQFLFALCWIVYVIYLPQLAAQAGIAKGAVAWILMADQLVFVFADYASGVAADRVSRVVGRVGVAVLVATLVSCLAFLALPLVAPGGSPVVFITLTMLWAVTSSALRAPPLALLGRHVTQPSQPLLLALTLLGVGIANALAPYLGRSLRELDPRLPFALSSGALALVTLGLVVAERRLAAAGAARRGSAEVAATPAPAAAIFAPAPIFIVAAVFAALAFQVHVFIDSAPLYLRHANAAQLPTLLPAFWIGFNIGMVPMAFAVKRWPAPRVMAIAAVAAACGSVLATLAGSLPLLVSAQIFAGVAWSGVLVAAFSWALARGGASGAGAFAGALSSVLALATLARMASVSAGWPKSPLLAPAFEWGPLVGWLAAGAVIAVVVWRRRPA